MMIDAYCKFLEELGWWDRRGILQYNDGLGDITRV